MVCNDLAASSQLRVETARGYAGVTVQHQDGEDTTHRPSNFLLCSIAMTVACMARPLEQDRYHSRNRMPGYPGSMRIFLVMASLSVSLVLPACAQLCGDTGTREGAWGLVFRCSTGSRMQIHTAASGRGGVSGTRKQYGKPTGDCLRVS